MAGKYLHTAKKLQTACKKRFGVKLLIQQRQWYSDAKDMAITVYSINRVTTDNGKKINVELFKTYSQIQLVLFMRDLWYELNGWEVPHDNKQWEEIKANSGRDGQPSDTAPEKQRTGDREYTVDTDGAGIFNELY